MSSLGAKWAFEWERTAFVCIGGVEGCSGAGALMFAVLERGVDARDAANLCAAIDYAQVGKVGNKIYKLRRRGVGGS